jgi:uncharacterized membrane protein
MSETKSTTGMDQNIASLLCYVLGFITGLIFVIIEKDNKVVRFHAFQSLFTFLAIFVLQIVIGIVISIIPFLAILSLLFTLAVLGLWIFLMIKAFQNEMVKLPIVGDLAAKQAGV